MRKFIFGVIVTLTLTAMVAAEHHFAAITAVDAEKGIITFDITFGKKRLSEVKANVARDCVIKEGYYRLGKPATTKEGDDIPNGLGNAVFKNATVDKSLRVNIYRADADDKDKGIKRGDVIKILVNPTKKK